MAGFQKRVEVGEVPGGLGSEWEHYHIDVILWVNASPNSRGGDINIASAGGVTNSHWMQERKN